MQVLSLTEFTGINENGNKKEKQRTFSQATITGIEHWWWGYEDYDSVEYSFFMVELSIGKFEFTSIEVGLFCSRYAETTHLRSPRYRRMSPAFALFRAETSSSHFEYTLSERRER